MLTMKTLGLKAALKEIKRVNKNANFAAVRALTQTAVIAKGELQDEMKRSLDRPTRYTLNSVFVQPATKAKPSAKVGLKNIATKGGRPATKYLEPVLEGSNRGYKGVESVLRKKGLLPNGFYVVPSRELRLNKSGNVTRNQVIKILNGIRPSGAYFVANIKGTHGVWMRKGRKVKPVFIFVRRPNYDKLFDFYDVAEDSFGKHFDAVFRKSFKQALRK